MAAIWSGGRPRRLRDAGFFTGWVDLLRVATKAELAEAIADACLGNLTRTAKALRTLKEWAAPVWGS